MMKSHLSFAQICAQAAGVEIVQIDGLYMTKSLASAAGAGKNNYSIVRQQLKATQDFVVERSKAADKPFELMRLPYDVRHLVLEYAVGFKNMRVFLRGGGFRRGGEIPIPLPEAARAGSQQLRRECLLVALKLCTIEIHSGPGNAALQAWLTKVDFTGIDSFCQTGFDAITSLTFPYFSRFPYGSPTVTKNNDVGLALSCKNLRSLSVHFVWEELARVASRHSSSGDDFAAKCGLDIRKSYQLDGLLDAAKLEKLEFRTYVTGSSLAGLTEVVAWFEREFQERNQKVVIKMGY